LGPAFCHLIGPRLSRVMAWTYMMYRLSDDDIPLQPTSMTLSLSHAGYSRYNRVINAVKSRPSRNCLI
jgi:hypothetical protein